MNQTKDVIIVHSGFLTADTLQLDSDTEARVKEGIRLYNNGIAPYLFMNGGPGGLKDNTGKFTGFLPRESPKVHSDIMTQYALERGVPQDSILQQRFSADTVGETLFGLGEVIIPQGFRNVISVSVNYHGMRIQSLTARIWGNGYTNEFVGIVNPANPDELEVEKANEWNRLNTFLTSFKDIPTGDAKAFETALYERHGLYKLDKVPLERRVHFDY